MTTRHNQQAWQQFLDLCRSVNKSEVLDDFFDFIFTSEEREMIASRIIITEELLKQEKPQRQISKETGVSIAKITRGSNSLKNIDAGLRKLLVKKLVE
ncbi:MAG: trp operon repressor [Coxiellaceae bacterium]|nr:trp operon repressor [Coxiellaceae bacterium]